jgi:hypothetical protein
MEAWPSLGALARIASAVQPVTMALNACSFRIGAGDQSEKGQDNKQVGHKSQYQESLVNLYHGVEPPRP